MAKQDVEHFKIRSGAAVAQRVLWECWASASLAEAKRRRDGNARGWGPARTK